MSNNLAFLCPEVRRQWIEAAAASLNIPLKWVDSDQDQGAIADQLRGVSSVIMGPAKFSVELAKACPDVKFVQMYSAGYDRMDISGLAELGVSVANNGGANAIAVSEHTVALIVALFRKLQLQFNATRDGLWNANIRQDWLHGAWEVAGKTVGIVGAGRIGRRVARRLQGWECSIIYSDIVPMPEEDAAHLGAERVSLSDLLETSDVVSLHVPLGDQTRHMISDNELGMMKSTAILINTCRGPVVDEKALIRALQEGRIAGACLDVLEVEPADADNPLLKMDNVLVTPHLATMTREAFERSRQFAILNAARAARGEEPDSVIPAG